MRKMLLYAAVVAIALIFVAEPNRAAKHNPGGGGTNCYSCEKFTDGTAYCYKWDGCTSFGCQKVYQGCLVSADHLSCVMGSQCR